MFDIHRLIYDLPMVYDNIQFNLFELIVSLEHDLLMIRKSIYDIKFKKDSVCFTSFVNNEKKKRKQSTVTYLCFMLICNRKN